MQINVLQGVTSFSRIYVGVDNVEHLTSLNLGRSLSLIQHHQQLPESHIRQTEGPSLLRLLDDHERLPEAVPDRREALVAGNVLFPDKKESRQC